MTKRLNQLTSIIIKSHDRDHIVTLERLKNDVNGNPRFKAIINFLESGTKSIYNAVYTFKGHYSSDEEEANFIVDYYYNNSR